ncbi:MAG: patatin-like phospholipase family protein [Gemmatimonadota bacterium]|nr:patatin-like phospholipase family protein [Gemmatimonadota bacterium]
MPNRNVGLTLAGGGNRAFLQLGILGHWWPRLEPRVAAVSACSAGASMAITFFSGRAAETHAYWLERRSVVTRNFTWSRLLRGQRPTPHLPIYRDTTLFALADGGFERIQALPFPLWILMAELPHGAPIGLAVSLGFSAYTLEKMRDPGKLHPVSGRRLGFRPLLRDARRCSTPEELTSLVLASSATPPFLPVPRIDGHLVADGGMVDNAPAFAAELDPAVRQTLILLTRWYRPERVGFRGRRWYLAPSRRVEISRWEYTRPDLVADTLAMGREEANRWDSRFDAWLA